MMSGLTNTNIASLLWLTNTLLLFVCLFVVVVPYVRIDVSNVLIVAGLIFIFGRSFFNTM